MQPWIILKWRMNGTHLRNVVSYDLVWGFPPLGLVAIFPPKEKYKTYLEVFNFFYNKYHLVRGLNDQLSGFHHCKGSSFIAGCHDC